MTDTLVYEDLVEAFEHSLLHQLRGHGAAVPYLDTWVPDPDPVRSLLNMLEAAELAYCVSPFQRRHYHLGAIPKLPNCRKSLVLV